MAKISALNLAALDTPVRPHHEERASIARQQAHQRDVSDFLYALSCMREMRKYRFAGDTLEGIYASVEHKGYVTDGQRKAVNNIRRGCGEGAI